MQIDSIDAAHEYVRAWTDAEHGIHSTWVTPYSNARRFVRTADDHRNIARSYASNGYPLHAGTHEAIAETLLHAAYLAGERAHPKTEATHGV